MMGRGVGPGGSLGFRFAGIRRERVMKVKMRKMKKGKVKKSISSLLVGQPKGFECLYIGVAIMEVFFFSIVQLSALSACN